jgi:hypothetical protein
LARREISAVELCSEVYVVRALHCSEGSVVKISAVKVPWRSFTVKISALKNEL